MSDKVGITVKVAEIRITRVTRVVVNINFLYICLLFLVRDFRWRA